MPPEMANAAFEALGSTFRAVKLGVGVVLFNAGQTSSIELPNSLLQKGLTLRLSGNAVISVATATAAVAEAPLGLIKNIQIIGDGRRLLFNSPARDLFRLAHYTWQKQGEVSPPLLTVGTRPFSATIQLDNEMLLAGKPSESLFDPRLYKKVELKITWGQIADVIQVGPATVTFSGVQVDVLADQTSEGVGMILFDHTVTPDEANVTTTSTNFSFRVPQNGLLAGVMVRADRDAGAGAGPVPVDDLITAVTIKSDQTVIHYDAVAWATLQRQNVIHFDLDGGATPGAQIPGWAYLPFMEHGMISSCLNTNALNNLQIIFSVTRISGTETVHLTYNWLEPRRSVAQAITAS